MTREGKTMEGMHTILLSPLSLPTCLTQKRGEEKGTEPPFGRGGRREGGMER